MLNYMERFTRGKDDRGGVYYIKGTRVPVRIVLADLAAGDTVEQILQEFPSLSEEDIRACIAFAAASTMEDIPNPTLPSAS